MMHIRELGFALITGALLCMPGKAQNNIVDEVIWVVGDDPILRSDVEAERLNAELSGQQFDGNPFCRIAEMIAVQKLFLHQSEIDSIEVTDGEVLSEVTFRENQYLQNFGSTERIEQFTKKTMRQLREMWKEPARNNLLIQRMQQKIVENVKVTPAEVRQYYKDVPEDSLPLVPTQVEVQIITQTPDVPRKEIERVENQLREYARRVNEGETEFSTLAMLYSQDGSARNGGELGYMNRTALAPEFANVAFSLTDPKKVSKIVKTEYGYHIIQLIGRQGDKVNVRHILLKPEVPQSEIDKAMLRLDSISNDLREGKFTFDEAAAFLSDDKDTRNNHGIMVNVDQEMGARTSRFEMQDLPQDVAKVVDTLKTGAISRPFTLIKNGGMKKGDVLNVAQVGGIMGAKRTSDIIPMCHPIMISGVDIDISLCEERHSVEIIATTKCTGATGVEMEALTAVSVAALTVYDMCKAVQRDIEITDIRLLKKTGGKSGVFERK